MTKATIGAAILGLAVTASMTCAAVVITEVDSAGSSNASYAGDWFELTNTGTAAQDITNYTMDDNSNAAANSVALHGITSIAAGQSVVFIEATTTSAYDASLATTEIANFKTAWFGANVPANFTIGSYGGTSVGLSSSADAVNIFDASGNKVTGVNFNAAPAGATFDNAGGSQTGTTNPTLSTASVVGVNGAFKSADGIEIGSPGTTTPEPASLGLLGVAATLLMRRQA